MDPHDDDPRIPGGRAGDQVGLGRVVENRQSTGSPGPGDPGGPEDDEVEEASEDSFPASDPPSFTREGSVPDREP